MPLIRLFFDICLMRKGPQHCPASDLLVGLVVGANLVVGVLLGLASSDGAAAMGQSLAGIVLLSVFLLAALHLSGKWARWPQTITAAFGADTLLSLIAGVFILMAELLPDAGPGVGMALLLLMLWQIAVLGHILRHALDLPVVAGMALSLAYFVVSYRILMTLFPILE